MTQIDELIEREIVKRRLDNPHFGKPKHLEDLIINLSFEPTIDQIKTISDYTSLRHIKHWKTAYNSDQISREKIIRSLKLADETVQTEEYNYAQILRYTLLGLKVEQLLDNEL